MSMLSKLTRYARERGVAYTLRRLAQKANEAFFGAYDRLWERLRPDAEELARQRAHLPDAGLISVVIPTYNTRPELLMALCDSLTAQTYPRWEACLCDGGSTHPLTRAALERAMAMDERISVCFATENGGISANTNQAIRMARGNYIVLCDHDDLLTPDALWRVAEAVQLTHADMLYSDEDKVTEDGRHFTDPHCKMDFCPDNLRSSNYICHLLALKKSLVEAVGGLRPAFDGSQDHDLALRCAEKARRVKHIPYILYHWRTVKSSESHQHLEKCQSAACRAVEESCAAQGYPCTASPFREALRLRYAIRGTPRVDALLFAAPGRDASACREALRSDWPALSVETSCAKGVERFRAVNRFAAASTADFLLVMDAQARPAQPDFLRELLMYAQREDVGAVTPALVDGRGHLVHAGFALMDSGWAVGRNRGLRLTAGGWHGLAMQSHNVAAVCAGCFLIRRDHFVPFAPQLAEDEMIRWCAALRAEGLYHVYTPFSVARVPRRFQPAGDIRLRHPMTDPCMSPSLTQGKKADFLLRKGVKHHAAYQGDSRSVSGEITR